MCSYTKMSAKASDVTCNVRRTRSQRPSVNIVSLTLLNGFQSWKVSLPKKVWYEIKKAFIPFIDERLCLSKLSRYPAELLLWYLGFDQHRKEFQRRLPPEITSLDGDHVRDSFLHEV